MTQSSDHIFFTVPGITRFIQSQSPAHRIETHEQDWLNEFDTDEMNLLYALGSLSGSVIIEKVKEYNNMAFELGIEEDKEMARGRLLNVLESIDDEQSQ